MDCRECNTGYALVNVDSRLLCQKQDINGCIKYIMNENETPETVQKCL